MSVFNIPAGVSFLDALASGLLALAGNDPLALAGFTILLPTRRAGRALADTFLRQGGGRPMLLPRLRTLGDPDLDSLTLTEDDLPDPWGGEAIPDPVSPLRRQLLLTRLIQARGGLAISAAQAAQLARDLAAFLDQALIQERPLERLGSLVPETYAEHWQEILRFLQILTRHWPAILGQERVIDRADHRNRILRAQAAAWKAAPPAGVVVAAGSTGSLPATAELLTVIAGLPQGQVVLPGLDVELDEAAWQAVDASHPQYNLKRLLERFALSRQAVPLWPMPGIAARPARARLLSAVMRPAATTEDWRTCARLTPDSLAGLCRVEAASPQEEATLVALRLRQALETPGETAALVTSDGYLARRVMAILRRWGIGVDDSGGRPLADTSRGAFLRLVAEMALHQAAPVPLLALLKHPLAAGGEEPRLFRRQVRHFEQVALRGPRPGTGFAGLRHAVRSADDSRFSATRSREDLLAWLAGLDVLAADFLACVHGPPVGLSVLVDAHVALAEALAATASQPGAERLWWQDDGEAAATFIHDLRQAVHDFPAVAGPDYPALFTTLMGGRVVRSQRNLHPRLAILGPLEARLRHADVMILAGLNEGVWPADPSIDPWMSRPMRTDFGLPPPEHQIGLAAHDFVQACGAPQVMLCRAARVEGAPTVPSRWLTRLDAALRASGLPEGALPGAPELLAVVWALDKPDRITSLAPPAPCPPVSARPRRLSVTEVETWIRDPYAIYARHVLGLKALEPLAADPGAAERGQLIHAALDVFLRRFPRTLPADAEQALLQIGQEVFGDVLALPDVRAFWWPRFARIARWVVGQERQNRPAWTVLASECRGDLTLSGPAGPFQLTARADRIDRHADGGLRILDYKTGVPPTLDDLRAGFAPQLSLEAAIALAGGFAEVAIRPETAIAALSIWHLSGNDPPARIHELTTKTESSLDSQVAAARAGLERLIAVFDCPDMPYRAQPRPDFAPRFSDYTHLARVAEWILVGDRAGDEQGQASGKAEPDDGS